jgi:hypothetical protein
VTGEKTRNSGKVSFVEFLQVNFVIRQVKLVVLLVYQVKGDPVNGEVVHSENLQIYK